MDESADRNDASADLLDELVKGSFTVMALLSRLAADHDLSLTQLRVLGILRGRTPTMAELATYLGLERSSVSGLIDRAARRGLVRRKASAQDGRVVRVSLTDAGEAFAAAVTSQLGDEVQPMMSGLSTAELRSLGGLLSRLSPRSSAIDS